LREFSLNLVAQCLAVIGCVSNPLADGCEDGFLQCSGHRSIDQARERPGHFNPGNVGTYEGGTMLIGKMFGLKQSDGIGFGLSRRLRSLFWAAVGIICFVLLTRQESTADPKSLRAQPQRLRHLPKRILQAPVHRKTKSCFAILLPKERPGFGQFQRFHSLESARYRSFSERYLQRKRPGQRASWWWATPPSDEKCSVRYSLPGDFPNVSSGLRPAAGASHFQRFTAQLSTRRPANDWF